MSELATTQANIIKILFMKGIAVQMGQMLDRWCSGCSCGGGRIDEDEKGVTHEAKKTTKFNTEEDEEFLESRPPVVTIMGHVDHGKTSLLDYIPSQKLLPEKPEVSHKALVPTKSQLQLEKTKKKRQLHFWILQVTRRSQPCVREVRG